MKRKLIIALALCLALALGIGGTMAYLTATTTAVVNTFTIGNVGLTLAETKGTEDADGNHQFKMVPGNTIDKDPTVTVTAGSEACWLFVKLVKANGFDTYLTYDMADGWTELTGVEGVAGVYYREVTQSDAAQAFAVLANNQVTVRNTVVQSDSFVAPTLTISAAAIQRANIDDAAAAYDKLPGDFKN